MKRLFARLRPVVGVAIVFTLGVSLSGCPAGTRVMYPKSGDSKVLQLRETKKGVKIWYRDSTGAKLPGVSDLLDGGFYRFDLMLKGKR